jgi:carboxymethylenebutenolidase
MAERSEAVEVEGGAVPIHVQGPEDSRAVPGLVVVPSIFGPAPDLLKQMAQLSNAALVVVADPFWRISPGPHPYDDKKGAFARLEGFEMDRCLSDMRAVIEWTRERCNGQVAGLGICFGGPVVLVVGSEGALAGIITWHGTRMENYLDLAERISCPLRFEFGGADPVTPHDTIEKLRTAFAAHPDASFVVHPGLDHGYSHEGSTYDPSAAQAGVDTTRALLAGL